MLFLLQSLFFTLFMPQSKVSTFINYKLYHAQDYLPQRCHYFPQCPWADTMKLLSYGVCHLKGEYTLNISLKLH
jgi:hypothetical protein